MDKRIKLSSIGLVADQFWKEIPNHFPHVFLDEYIIMPNHVHGILKLDYSNIGKFVDQTGMNYQTGYDIQTGYDNQIGTLHGASLFDNYNKKFNKFGKPVPGSVSVIINHYKSAVKRWCNNNGNPFFTWQPRFYDHIINNRKELENIRNYILSNPARFKDPAKQD